jgi:hypothetical protein
LEDDNEGVIEEKRKRKMKKRWLFCDKECVAERHDLSKENRTDQ